MKFLFRVDASFQIGTGHVMRCLTLAKALQPLGVQIAFICRDLPGNLNVHIKKAGFQIFELPAPLESLSASPVQAPQLTHAEWLGVSQRIDFADSLPIVQTFQPDWLIVDHYALDNTWQTPIKKIVKKLMVIDDLADRYHDCDLLLDQSFGRTLNSYKDKVPKTCQCLLGAKFALLRTEFAAIRSQSLERRLTPCLKKVMISLGGVDAEDVTSEVLESLETVALKMGLDITVVLGASALHAEKVKNGAINSTANVKVLQGVDNMSELMMKADFAIGAAGATTWERCCLGLPSALIVLAQNQQGIAEAIAQQQAGWVFLKEDISLLSGLVKSLTMEDLRKASKNAAKMVDGLGGERVKIWLMKP